MQYKGKTVNEGGGVRGQVLELKINYEFKTKVLRQLGCVLESPYPILLMYDALYEWSNPYNLTAN